MTHCPRCHGTAHAGGAFCGWCGLALHPAPPRATAPAGPTPHGPTPHGATRVRSAPSPGAAPHQSPARTPGTITAVRVMLGLNGAGLILTALLDVGLAVAAQSVGDAVARSGLDDGTRATMSTLVGVVCSLAVLCAVIAAVDLWAIGAIAARRRAARTAVTAVQVVNLLVGPAVIAVAGAEAVGPILLSMPFVATLLVLLWGPSSSRRWFDDAPDDAPDAAPVTPRPDVDADAHTEALTLPVVPFPRRPLPIPARR